MTHQEDKNEEKYRTLRNEFDLLQLEEKAVFLIESGLSLFLHSMDSLARFIRDEVNKMAEGSTRGDAAEDEEGVDTEESSEFARDIASEDVETNSAKKSEEDNEEDKS